MKFLCLLILVLVAAASSKHLRDVLSSRRFLTQDDESVEEDAHLNFTELVTKYGYPWEEHHVTTNDGYILTLFRIPYGRRCGPGGAKVPVILSHGLTGSADDSIILGPENSLGYILADECYDVWFLNNRGNRYSRGHEKFHVEDVEYWQFTLHELGTEDLTAAIDFTLAETGRPNLHIAGYSQGGTIMFILAATRPEYLNKIRSIEALAPGAYMKRTENIIFRLISITEKNLARLVEKFKLYDLLPLSNLANFVGMKICRPEYPILHKICIDLLEFFIGTNLDQLNAGMLNTFLAHIPAGCAMSQVFHIGQFIKGGFRQYDYGPEKNLKLYNTTEPPRYKVESINVPVALYYSNDDSIIVEEDIFDLERDLPNATVYRVQGEGFGHVGFIWAKNLKSVLLDQVVRVMKTY